MGDMVNYYWLPSLLVFADAAKDGWLPGTGLVSLLSALIAGGIGGGGAVALVMTYWGLKHLKEKDAAMLKLVDTVSTRNALVTEKLLQALDRVGKPT